MKDFVIYCDTDSTFFSIEEVIAHYCGLDKWNTLPDDQKLEYCKKIANVIIKNINDRSFRETQLIDCNSNEQDFKLEFKQEIIAKMGIFVAKKKYTLRVIDEEGVSQDKITTKGLEIIQSSTPAAIKERLEDIITRILREEDEDIIKNKIKTYAAELKQAPPEEIALNIGAQRISKYSLDGQPAKGCPYHIRGILNYRNIGEVYGLDLPEITSGGKVKTVYVNPFTVGFGDKSWECKVISFHRWPSNEFTKLGIMIDYKTMIHKSFFHKIQILLKPINKLYLLEDIDESK